MLACCIDVLRALTARLSSYIKAARIAEEKVRRVKAVKGEGAVAQQVGTKAKRISEGGTKRKRDE